jgi:hypothetical protein
VEGADDAPLENRPEAFDGLSVDCADDILTSGVVNGRVREIFVEDVVCRPLIGTKQADFVGDGFSDKCVKRRGLDIRDYPRDNIPPTADGADNRSFAGTNAAGSTATAAFIPMTVFCQAADESFINFDDTAELINILHQRSSDLMTHEPSGFIGTEAHITIKLQSAHAFLAGQHEVSNLEPVPQRFVGVLENRSGDMRKSVRNTPSAVHTLPLKGHGFEPIDMTASATRAADAFGPPARNEIDSTSVLVREHGVELGRRELVNWLGLLAAGHDALLSMERSIS